MSKLPTSIDEVIQALEAIIQESKTNNSALGFFPTLYQRVTIKIKEGIANGAFKDGQRMERLDVVFANRYLDAYHKFKSGKPTTLSWQLAFEATQKDELLIIQHLLCGINAHINLDLGLAASQVSPGENIYGLEEDFKRINDVLFSLVDQVQGQLSSVSPLLWFLDWVGANNDEKFAEFSLKATRIHAWWVALRFAEYPEEEWNQQVDQLDKQVAEFGSLLKPKSTFLKSVFSFIRWFENKDNTHVINLLKT